MTSIFNGMATVLNDVLGGAVLYTPKGDIEAQMVQAKLRTGPLEVAGGDGAPILILAPTLHVPKTVLPNIKKGDRVAAVATPDVSYLVVNKIPNGSPASDATIVCELEVEQG
jgi:hypothetical protein